VVKNKVVCLYGMQHVHDRKFGTNIKNTRTFHVCYDYLFSLSVLVCFMYVFYSPMGHEPDSMYACMFQHGRPCALKRNYKLTLLGLIVTFTVRC